MDVFGKGTDEPSRPLLPPGTCWVCSNSPQQEGMKVIDTRRNTQAGGSLSHDSNRIYICEPCATQLGKAIGLVERDEYESVVDKLRDADLDLTRVRNELESARGEQHRVLDADLVRTMLRDELAKAERAQVKAKPAPRKVASAE